MTITLPAADFVRGVNSVLACASDDRTVPAINCVYVAWDADGFVFVATDRYVCAEQTIPLADEAREPGKVSIPLEAVKAALTVLKATAPKGNLADDRKVEIVPAGEWARGSVAGIDFETSGEFPKYRSLFPHADAQAEVGRILFDPALLGKLSGPKVRGKLPVLALRFTGELKPIVVTRVSRDHEVDATFRALLMPVRPA